MKEKAPGLLKREGGLEGEIESGRKATHKKQGQYCVSSVVGGFFKKRLVVGMRKELTVSGFTIEQNTSLTARQHMSIAIKTIFSPARLKNCNFPIENMGREIFLVRRVNGLPFSLLS